MCMFFLKCFWLSSEFTSLFQSYLLKQSPNFRNRGVGYTVPYICLFVQLTDTVFNMFELMLFNHGKQLRSCPDGQLLTTVPGQGFRKQFTSI